MTPLRRLMMRIAARRPAGEPRPASPPDHTEPTRTSGRRRRRSPAASTSPAPDATPATAPAADAPGRQAKTKQTAQTRTTPTGGRRGGTASRGGGNSDRSGAGGDNGAGGGQTSPRAYSWGRAVGDDDEARREMEQRRLALVRKRRGYRPPRDRLDQPLPEDIAFRSADEGGDPTILPGRRRKPKGLRTTERVIFAGARFIGFARKPLPSPDGTPGEQVSASEVNNTEAADHLGELEAAEEARIEAEDADRLAVAELAAREREEAAEQAAAAAEEAAKKRRRGRRGGRRHAKARANARDAAALHTVAITLHPPAGADTAATAGAAPTGNGASAGVAAAEIEDGGEAATVRPARRRRAAAPAEPTSVPEVAPEDYPEAFRALGLDDRSLAVMAAFGFERPTPIQERAIPALLAGGDVVGLAQTGSGKTVAFGVPMVERLDPERPEVQAIVLVPTRELAQQVLDVLQALGRPYGLEAIGLLGGRALKRDFRALEDRPHIVVGTPGRVIDHLRRRSLSLRHVTYAVLDEADQMLDIGFLPDIRRILSYTPEGRQTALFSATMPTTIKRLVWQFMRDPETVSVDEELSTVESTTQVYVEVAQRDKVRGLRELIDRELKGRTLVFCRMKRGVDRLARDLNGMGVRVGALHGDMDQRKRDSVVTDFRNGRLDVLVATNVAARGLDIPEITHVVNFDAPQNAEEYVHRIGRTGRAGREGKAITFICENDLDELDMLIEQFGDDLQRERLDLYA